MVMYSMTVLARGAREIFSTLRYIRAIWTDASLRYSASCDDRAYLD